MFLFQHHTELLYKTNMLQVGFAEGQFGFHFLIPFLKQYRD